MIIDWDDAFDNGGHVEGSADFVIDWASRAAAARAEFERQGQAEFDLIYGARPRNRFDLFSPSDRPAGLVVFVHGGYWHKLDKSYWSHLARGSLEGGWAFAVAGYTLAPEVRISAISTEIGAAIDAAAGRIDGPVRLVGHSAGGHLVTRMACDDSPLSTSVRQRLDKVLAISGVFDLQPLLLTRMNRILGLDAAEARLESPLRHQPRKDLDLNFWVGAGERPEFLRQTRIITERWADRGARVADYYQPGQHHFSVIDALARPVSELSRRLLE